MSDFDEWINRIRRKDKLQLGYEPIFTDTELAFMEQAFNAGKPQWISVKDRLPDDKNTYLVITKYQCIDICFKDGGHWYADCDNHIVQQVTHWMPMPEPPKEDDTHPASETSTDTEQTPDP